MIGEIRVGDCLVELRSMPDDSVAGIATAPPGNYCSGETSWGKGYRILDDGFDGHDDAMADIAYIAWQREFIIEALRVTHPQGAVLMVGGGFVRNGRWQDYAPAILEGFPVRQRLVWLHRPKGTPEHDGIALPGHYSTITVVAGDQYRFPAAVTSNVVRASLDEGYPWSVAGKAFRYMLCLIPMSSQPVVDPFAGLGTIGLAASQHGRSWIAIEQSPRYCQEAYHRLKAAAVRCTLTGEGR